MHKLTFYPLGNADCCLIDLNNGRKILCDYANMRDEKEEDDLRIDLEKAIRSDLKDAKRKDFDVVIFTHLDNDHICRSSELFYLDHAKKYQDESRIKIKELWVPVGAILEKGVEDETAIIRAEARHRFKEGKGIRVFSRPDALKNWCKEEGIDFEARKNLITDAGKLVPGWTKADQGAEFFIHSPFAKHSKDGIIERNEGSIVMQVTFQYDGTDTRLILSADTDYEVWADIVNITKSKNNEARLIWDIYKLPHHCSYTALSSDKGKDKTNPIDEVKWLHKQGQKGGLIVSTSKPIPPDDDDKQPPHRQAANWYKDVAEGIEGEFIATMEHPRKTDPKPLVITIDGDGAKLNKPINSGIGVVLNTSAPRVG